MNTCGSFLFVWDTGGARKSCRDAPRPYSLYLGPFACILVCFCLVSVRFRLPDGAGLVQLYKSESFMYVFVQGSSQKILSTCFKRQGAAEVGAPCEFTMYPNCFKPLPSKAQTKKKGKCRSWLQFVRFDMYVKAWSFEWTFL